MAQLSSAVDTQAAQLSRALLRTRASVACIACRAKKSRCDVEKGGPCTNCKADNVSCTVAHNGSRRISRSLRRLEAMKRRNLQILTDGSVFSSQPGHIGWSHSITDDGTRGLISEPPASTSQSADVRSRRSVSADTEDILSPELFCDVEDYFQPGVPQAPLDSAEFSEFGVELLRIGNFDGHLPEYIKPLPAHLSRDSLKFLKAKGALRIPPTEARDALFHAYIDYVHPFLPILDLSNLLCFTRTAEASSDKLSLLLCQAAMFAGSSFVDIKTLEISGFQSRRGAREEFYQRLKLLYEFDVENDAVTSAQALLLMTYWYESPDDQKDMYHWLAVAVSTMTKLGLHQAATYANLPVEKRGLCRRIWWCCIMRDVIMALGMKRGTRINSNDYDLPILSLEDFELTELPSTLINMTPDRNMITDLNMRLQLAVVCLQKLKLCLILRDVLSVWYTSRGNRLGKTALILMPITDEVDKARDDICEFRLARWLEELPVQASYNPLCLGTLDHPESVLEFHRALLRMFYLTTVITFQRPRSNPSVLIRAMTTPDEAAGIHTVAKQATRTAATEISEILNSLDRLDMVRFLPLNGVAILTTAMVGHIMHSYSPDRDVRTTSLKHFRDGYRMIQLLRNIYSGADYATHFIHSIVFSGISFTPHLAEIIELEWSLNNKEHKAAAAAADDNTDLSGSASFDVAQANSLCQINRFDITDEGDGIGHSQPQVYGDQHLWDLPHMPTLLSSRSTCSSHSGQNTNPSSLLVWMQDYLPRV